MYLLSSPSAFSGSPCPNQNPSSWGSEEGPVLEQYGLLEAYTTSEAKILLYFSIIQYFLCYLITRGDQKMFTKIDNSGVLSPHPQPFFKFNLGEIELGSTQ